MPSNIKSFVDSNCLACFYCGGSDAEDHYCESNAMLAYLSTDKALDYCHDGNTNSPIDPAIEKMADDHIYKCFYLEAKEQEIIPEEVEQVAPDEEILAQKTLGIPSNHDNLLVDIVKRIIKHFQNS